MLQTQSDHGKYSDTSPGKSSSRFEHLKDTMFYSASEVAELAFPQIMAFVNHVWDGSLPPTVQAHFCSEN